MTNEEEIAALFAGLDQFGSMGTDLAHIFGRIYEALAEHNVPEKTAHVVVVRLLDQALPPPKTSLGGLFPGLGEDS